MSIETARIEVLRSPSSLKKRCRVWAFRPAWPPHDPAGGVVDYGREVAVMAAVADLVHADRDKAGQPPGIEVIDDDPCDDLPD